MEFEKDIYISYAHPDDIPSGEHVKGWITGFHKLLQMRLEQTIGHKLNIWRYERFTGNEVFAPEISTFSRTKIMIAIITPGYLKSAWCIRELEEFYRAARENGGISFKNKSRIYKVEKTPVDGVEIERLPKDIRKIYDETLSYKFYLQEISTGKFTELDRGSWVDNTTQLGYWSKLDELAYDIADLLQEMEIRPATPEVKAIKNDV